MANSFEQITIFLLIFWGFGLIMAMIFAVDWSRFKRKFNKFIKPYKIKLAYRREKKREKEKMEQEEEPEKPKVKKRIIPVKELYPDLKVVNDYGVKKKIRDN